MAEQTAPRTAAIYLAGRRARATFVLEGMLELQRMRGRLSKVSVDDVALLLAALPPEAAASPAAPAVEPLRAALERLLANAEHIFDKKPVRDWAETLAEARAALQASLPTARPSTLDVGLPPLTDEQADEGERRLHEAGPFDALSDADSRAVELLREVLDKAACTDAHGKHRPECIFNSGPYCEVHEGFGYSDTVEEIRAFLKEQPDD